MFSRQDAEHNEIALKKAATAGKINEVGPTIGCACTVHNKIEKSPAITFFVFTLYFFPRRNIHW